jgi:pyruvate formate lyase activating enzyme
MRDKDYYAASGGGVTFSGGEPFAQFEGLLTLLQQSKALGLHTVVETTGQTGLECLETAEPLIDLFLLDLKCADPMRLREVTGADTALILQSLTWLGQNCPRKVVGRVPVVPGFNDDEGAMRAIFFLAKEHNIAALDLLPYHTLGRDKYRQLGRPYSWPADKMLSPGERAPFAELGRSMGLSITVGG